MSKSMEDKSSPDRKNCDGILGNAIYSFSTFYLMLKLIMFILDRTIKKFSHGLVKWEQ